MKISNIAELKTRRGTTGFNVTVLGYYSAGDCGGGEFYWDNTSTETDNGGTIIQVTGLTTGRWKRVESNRVNVKCFGAYENGTTNDSSKVQSAINACSVIEFNNKTYLLTTTVLIDSNKTLIFNSSIFKNNSFTDTGSATSLNNYIFQADDVSNVSFLGKFTLTTDNVGTSCVTNGLYINIGEKVLIEDISLVGLNFGILLNRVQDSYIKSIYGKNIDGYQLAPSLGGDLLILLNSKYIKIDSVVGRTINKGAVYFSLDAYSDINDSISIDSIDVELKNSNVAAAVIMRKAKNVNIGNIISKNGASGFYLMLDNSAADIFNININSIFVKDNTAVSDNSYAVFITALYATNGNKRARNISIDSIVSEGSNKGGLIVDNCEFVKVNNIVVVSPTDDGIRLLGAKDVIMSNIDIRTPTKNGIIVNSTLSENVHFGKVTMYNMSNSFFGIRIDDNKLKTCTIDSLYFKGTLPSYGLYYAIMNSVATGFDNVTINDTNHTGFLNVLVYDYINQGRIYTQAIPSHPSTISKVSNTVYNSLPATAGYIGWVCVTAGTAGTWKGFGLIA